MVFLFYLKCCLDMFIKFENEIVIVVDMNGYWLRVKWKVDKNVYIILCSVSKWIFMIFYIFLINFLKKYDYLIV